MTCWSELDLLLNFAIMGAMFGVGIAIGYIAGATR